MKIKNLLKPDNWWILILSGVIAYMVYVIFSNPEYNKAFNFILPGLTITFLSTIISFIVAIFLGLVSGIGRISVSYTHLRAHETPEHRGCRLVG